MPCKYEKASLDFFKLIIKTFVELNFHAIATLFFKKSSSECHPIAQQYSIVKSIHFHNSQSNIGHPVACCIWSS